MSQIFHRREKFNPSIKKKHYSFTFMGGKKKEIDNNKREEMLRLRTKLKTKRFFKNVSNVWKKESKKLLT